MKRIKRINWYWWLVIGIFSVIIIGSVFGLNLLYYTHNTPLRDQLKPFIALATAQEQSADELVLLGREALKNKQLTNANTYFYSALQKDSQHQEANFFYSITRILSLSYQPEFNNLLDRFGVTSGGRDIYQWEADFARDLDEGAFQ